MADPPANPSSLVPEIFKPGRAITEEEAKLLTVPDAPSPQIDYARLRGILTLAEAQYQMEAYIRLIPADRRKPFGDLLGEGQKFADENRIDAFSGIGIYLGTSEKSTAVEKIIGLDLYLSSQLEFERLREQGR